MLNFLESMVGMLAISVHLVAIATTLEMSFRKRMALAAIVGAWVGLASHLGATGVLAFVPGRQTPVVGLLVAGPPLIVGILALTNQKFRAALLSIPTSLLVGLNSLRILAIVFFLLVFDGRLSGPFPYSAAGGDIITGLLAIALTLRMSRAKALPTGAIARWNIFGAIDLVAAIGFGLTSAEGNPLQIFHVGAGSLAMQSMPFSLVPTVLVPFYLITHGIIAAQLASRKSISAYA